MPFAIYFTSLKNKLYAREEKCGKDSSMHQYSVVVRSAILLSGKSNIYSLKMYAVPAPIKDEASIQKLFF